MPPRPPISDALTTPLWRALLVRLLLVAAGALLALLVHSATFALVIGIVGLLIMLVSQTRKLAALRIWLQTPDNRNFPQASGEWGAVFLELSRRLRELQKSGRASAEEKQAFIDAVNALPDGVVLLDSNNQILWCNRKSELHLGIDTRRDIGIVLPQLFRVPGFNEYLNQSNNDKPFIFQNPRATTRTHALEIIHYGILRKLLISYDITEMHRAEAMRRDFVANVSHELRTPLTVVSGFLEHFASGEEIGTAQRQRFVELMHDQSERMLRLVDDLLTLSRLEADELPQNEEYIALPEFLGQLLSEGESLSAGRHELVLEGELHGKLRGSRHELRSALGNLISNAVRYTPAGGRITLRWQLRGTDGVFSVQDSGVGIAAEHLPRLTERFYRVDKGRSRETGGTGLGLAIVKHVLLRHQAQLEIVSAPGAGSTFSARFPQWRCPP
jgi:two-component system, OmpR family, phosphate regulon sensor histidine kinase PhoR